MRNFLRPIAVFAILQTGLFADSAPALEWVKKLSGSGVSQVNGAAADANGNFYVVGTTSSLDLPTTDSAAQRNAGGSPLVRINAATGAADKLFAAGFSALKFIAADPRNPARLYAAVANGIFGSADAGSTWTPLATIASVSAINALAIDPSNSNSVYAATTTQGIWKSIDGGLTWSPINSGIAADTSGAITVFRLWVDPNAPQVVFAALNTALLRSADGGASWNAAASPPIINLVFDPFLPGTVYAVAPSQIVKSTDDGQTFTHLSALPGPVQVSALAADPLHPGVLFAGSTNTGIFQSVDSGATWTLKSKAPTTQLAADPNNSVIYAQTGVNGIVRSTDGFTTSSPIGPPEPGVTQIVAAGGNVFEVATPGTDVFAVKLDSNGNIMYATYFGGSAQDAAAAMAVGTDGSLYVAGSTRSLDFPTTSGAYAGPGNGRASFVFRLNPDGALGWSTYFADALSSIQSLAVDVAGNPYIGGSTGGDLPTTPGAYQTKFQQSCFNTGLIGCLPGPTSAFITKFNADGSGLVYSTYVPNDSRKNNVMMAQALAVDSSGNAWFGGQGNAVVLNSTGSALLASTVQTGIAIAAIALDSNSDFYATGTASPGYSGGPTPANIFPATPGAFQPAPQPAVLVQADNTPGGGTDAFVIKWDNTLSHILAATLLGGESADAGESIAVDPAGNVMVSGETDSKAFPTHAPFQTSFSIHSGFVAGFDPSLSHLLFSTYVGDEHPFDAHAVALDGRGNLLMAGYMLTASAGFFGLGEPTQLLYLGGPVVANKIALPAPPAVRLDSMVHAASHMAAPIAPGEPIVAVGSGFGAGAQLVIDGAPLAAVTASATSLIAVMPDSAKTLGGYVVQVSSGGVLSNPMFVPAAAASPGIFSTDGSGYGQAYILNSDGTLNSPANPAARGSAITIFAAGVGAFTLDHGYSVTALAPSVYIGGFYANGIAAVSGPVSGLPGNVYQLSVYVPNPATTFNPFGPQVSVRLVMGPVGPGNLANSAFISQVGIVLYIK